MKLIFCVEFVKLTFVKWSVGYPMVTLCLSVTTREIQIEKFIAQKWRSKYQRGLGRHTGRPRRVQADRLTGPGAHAFIRVHAWSALGFPGQVWTGQSNPNEQGFSKLHGGLCT